MVRHGWARRLIKDFENDPKVQFNFHRRAMYFWVANAVVATVLLMCFRSVWDAINIYYVAIISLYANFDTDFDAMSAAMGARNSEELLRRMEKS